MRHAGALEVAYICYLGTLYLQRPIHNHMRETEADKARDAAATDETPADMDM